MATINDALRCVDQIQEQLAEMPEVPKPLRDAAAELRQTLEDLADEDIAGGAQ